jgi:hypothetical protein
MLLRELLSRLRLMPDECRVQVAIPLDDGGVRIVPVVEALTDHNGGGVPAVLRVGPGEMLRLADVRDRLLDHDPDMMVRVAADHDADHVRMLDIDVVGFGGEIDAMPAVELRTEPWHALVMIIQRRPV